VIDGEIVALDPDGVPRFQLLQRRLGLTTESTIEQRMVETPVTFMAFDLLYLDGRLTMELEYAERRELLDALGLDGPRWQSPGYHIGQAAEMSEASRARGLEGIVAKRLNSPYSPGRRSGDWLKIRNRNRQEFVVGGWTPGEGGRKGLIGALLVGYWDSTQEEAKGLTRPQHLIFAGGVGTGFTDADLSRWAIALERIERETSPFDVGAPKRKEARFCEPQFVVEVEFTEWTHEGTLRQPSYKGLRDDKAAREVVRES
jgi:bifunctional non-homologous end joining protein LigD